VNMIDEFTKARLVGTPLICVTTPDQPGTVRALARATIELAERYNEPIPVLQLDMSAGLQGINEIGSRLAEKLLAESGCDGRDVPFVLSQMARVPEGTCVFLHNVQHYLESPLPIQAIANLRDHAKSTGKSLVMLAPAVRFPAELVQDVLILEERLPGESELSQVLDRLVTSFLETNPQFAMSEEERRQALDAVRGLSLFAAENAFAWCLEQKQLDIPRLWSVKERAVEQVKGVTFADTRHTFADVGGLTAFQEFIMRLAAGPHPISAIGFIDEIDKVMSGSTGPSGDNGVGADRLGVLLQFMQKHDLRGSLLLGVPGAGKTFVSQAAGKSLGVPTLELDLRAATGELQGQSEAYIRQLLDVVHAVGGDRIYFLATANRMDTLPPELRRRFKKGPWFFDLPDQGEKEAIWKIQLQRIGLQAQRLEVSFDILQPRPEDTDWTGSDIANCCQEAFDLGVSLVEAAQGIVPVAHQDPQSVKALRELADGSFLSSAYPGKYRKPEKELTALTATGERKFRSAA
jgi:hypothetical protein